jgi:hypothetical protein
MVFLGLLWDLVQWRISLPEPKYLKYLAHVEAMMSGAQRSQQFSLLELEEIHGTLCHIAFICRDGTSRLAVFSNAMAHYKGNTSALCFLSESVVNVLRWWRCRLLDPTTYRQLYCIGPLRDEHIYVDASTSWGLGIIIGCHWYSFKLRQGWKQPGRDICWLEAIVIELLYHFLIQLQFRDIHLLIHSDNKAAIGALTKSRSPNAHMNLCARWAYALAADHMIVPKLTYVESKLNPADAPSHRRALPLHNRLQRKFKLPADLAELFVVGDW